MSAKPTKKANTLQQKKNPWVIFGVVLVIVVVSAISRVYSAHKGRHLLNELKQLESQRNELQVEWGQLLLEQSSLAAQGRVENIALSKLRMEVPVVANIVVVQSD